jgi:Uma2 family endonuclease
VVPAYHDEVSRTELMTRMPEQVRPLRRREYDRLVLDGVFDGERVELLEGMLVRMSPQDPLHSDAVQWLSEALAPQLAPQLQLRVQLPLAGGGASEPEPDLAVVRRSRYRDDHPDSALLVVEVARTSQRIDLEEKPGIYAAAGVPEYWVVDLPARRVHAHRGPSTGGYAEVTSQTRSVDSSAVCGVRVELAALFEG